MGVRKGRRTAMGWETAPRCATSRSTLDRGTDMNNRLKTLAAAAALIVGITSAPAAYAHETSNTPGSMMDQGDMMQGGHMGKDSHGGYGGHGGQGGHMGKGGHGGMMGQMSQMMATCNTMMQAMMQHHQEESQNPSETPNDNEG